MSGDAVLYPITADRTLWVDETIRMIGDNLTGYSFHMQVRRTPDDSINLYANLTTVTVAFTTGVKLDYAGTDTVTNHIAAGRLTQDEATQLGYLGSTSITMSILHIYISDTIMSAMPAADNVGSDVNLAYDLLVTPSGGFPSKAFHGPFVVTGTVVR